MNMENNDEYAEDSFEESFEGEDEDVVVENDYNNDEAEEELFKENPLKAIWFRLGEIKNNGN